MATVTTPTFAFSGLYYPQILQDLLVDRRGGISELNDEDPNEPSVQLMRAFALVGHYSNTLLDHVALESLLPTARLRESVKAHLALIDVAVQEDVPASVDMLLTLSAPLAADHTVAALATFSTAPTEGSDEVQFEVLDEFTIASSESLDYIIEKDGATYTDRTATLTTAGSGTLSVWGGTSVAGDALYFGHEDVLFDRLDITTTVLGASALWDSEKIVVEVWDGRIDTDSPDSILALGGLDAGTTDIELTTLLGSVNRAGTTITVRSNDTGAKVDVVSEFGTENFINITDSDLGLSTPPTSTSQFTVGAKWREVENLSISTSGLVKTLTWTLPESTTRIWDKASFEDVTGHTDIDTGDLYWMRIRVITGGSSTPTLDKLDTTEGSQYVKVVATQGKTVTDVLGTSTGGGSQAFITLRPDLVEGGLSSVVVDDGGGPVTWTEVDNFLSSVASDLHFTLDYDEDGYGIITFGDGTNGKIPPLNADVTATYRIGASSDGNVAAGTITVSRGVSKVSSATNPRAASGWQIAEGSTPTDLERLKVAGPATLRAMNRAVTPADLETLTLDWESDSGASPFIRAKVIEGANGPKTVEIVTVESGTAATPTELMDEFETYLNGDTLLGIDGVMILNMEATATRYTPKTINVVATVKGGTKATIENALRALLLPNHVEEDGEWTYQFGGEVYRARVIAEVFRSDPAVSNVSVLTLNGSAADVTLGARELPVYGTVTVTVT
jgi:hypothetical protein